VEKQFLDRQTAKADCQQTTQLQPSVPNVPTTCRLVFKLLSVYQRKMDIKALSLELCPSNIGTPCGVGYKLRATFEAML